MVRARKFIYQRRFEGFPKENDIRLTEEELPPLRDGEFLSEAVFLSVDPYQRIRGNQQALGATAIGAQVAKVIESKNSNYPVGKYIVGEFGWRTHTISDGSQPENGFPAPWIIPEPEGLPLSLFLGVLGMPGITALYGFLEILQPQPGETTIVTGAGGAVGSIVGQIAKIKGNTVIGVAGSDEKGKWLVEELKFDHFLNYNDPNFEKKLAEVAPKGIDTYFDNVGGEITSIILKHLNPFGRISVCGGIAHYNEINPKVSPITFLLVPKNLKIEGFNFRRWLDRWYEGIEQNKNWIKEGKLKYRETVTEGFENTFKAFVDMLRGGNHGKAIVKI